MSILKYPYGARRAIPYSAEVQEYLDSVVGNFTYAKRAADFNHLLFTPEITTQIQDYSSDTYAPNRTADLWHSINWKEIFSVVTIIVTSALLIFGILVMMTPILNWVALKMSGY